MGKFYEDSIIPKSFRRNFSVYERINDLGIDLGTFEENVKSIQGTGLAGVIFNESGLVYLSGQSGGTLQMNDTEERVKHGQDGAQNVADNMIKRLHWAITCGGEGGDLDDVLYTVKALGMVVSTDVDFNSGPSVTNGFSFRWHSVFGGGMGDYSQNGLDSGGYSGVHARSAIGGFTGKFSIEPEIIVAIPKELSTEIISNRGWIFPLIPEVFESIKKNN